MMKVIIEEDNGKATAIKIEYTPEEALVINHAMRRYACDDEVNEKDREIMERMLDTKPIFIDISGEEKE